jgi:dihydrofolate reductase
MTIIAYTAVSLDGYIADEHGRVDWLNQIPNPDQSDYGFAAFMDSIDGIVMGANTFRVIQSFGVWPYEKPVFVVSNSIKQVPNGYEGRISLVKGELRKLITDLEKSGYERFYVDGGKLIQNFLYTGMLNEIIITHVPVTLGNGIPLFPKSVDPIQFEHQKTEVVGIGLVKSYYRVKQISH